MSDPFWDELNRSLPRAKHGDAGWAHRRRAVFSALKGARADRRGPAAALAFGLAVFGAFVALNRRPAPPPPSAQMPAEDLEFLESADLLENLDDLIDATELDRA